MIVVSDTSPLLHLARAGLLDVVGLLYGEVLVSRVVWRELVEGRPDAPEVPALLAATWLHVEDAADDSETARTLREVLDPGEASAIALAELQGAELLLVDERHGRAIAKARGLHVRGAVGVLVEAVRKGHLLRLRPALRALAASGLWIGAELEAEALRKVGE